MFSSSLQAGIMIAIILIVCISVSYYAFGGGDRRIPMHTSFMSGKCGWFIGALVVAALLIGLFGTCFPRLLPLTGDVSSLPSRRRGEVLAEGFVGSMNENLFDTFTSPISAKSVHAISDPFDVVANVNNPVNDAHVLQQSHKSSVVNKNHPCRLTLQKITAGSDYTLRIWIRTDNVIVRSQIEQNLLRPFDLRYITSAYDERPKSIVTNAEVRIIDTRQVDNAVWYLFEKTTPVTIPDDATTVYWYIGTTKASVSLQTSVYWCGFHISVYRASISDLTITRGLSSFYTAFDGNQSLTESGQWLDKSGKKNHATVSSGDTLPRITSDGGLILMGKTYGPPSSVLSSHTDDLSQQYNWSSSRENVGAFTIVFMYAKESNNEQVGMQRLLRVHADHFDADNGDSNPPTYMLDMHIDHDTNQLQISQQQKSNDLGDWQPVSLRVSLHADVAVYTFVHDGTKGIRIYINSTEVAVQADWFDRNYQIGDPNRRIVWNESKHTLQTLYATVTYHQLLSPAEIRSLAKYLMRKYNEVDDDRLTGQSTSSSVSSGSSTTHTELVELRTQMSALQQKLALAENTSATDPHPSFYNTATQSSSFYDPYGPPTDNTNLNNYVNRIRSIRGQLDRLRNQEAELLKRVPAYATHATIEDIELVKGMRVITKQDDQEAIVTKDQFVEQHLVYVYIDYVDGSIVDKKIRVSDLRLHSNEYWRLRDASVSKGMYCNRHTLCSNGQFCNYDRMDTPGEGICEPCDSIVACDRSFLVDTKSSCESQCPQKHTDTPRASNQGHHHILCDKQNPCKTGEFCNFANDNYGFCEACDVDADDLCDTEGLSKEGRRQCRKKCLAREQQPVLYRSELSDEEYNRLTIREKQNVLHDDTWNRTVRTFQPVTEDPADFEAIAHRHHSDGRVTASDSYDGHHEHPHGHGQTPTAA